MTQTTARATFVAQLRAADGSWALWVLVALVHSAANEIERLDEMLAEAEGALEKMING